MADFLMRTGMIKAIYPGFLSLVSWDSTVGLGTEGREEGTQSPVCWSNVGERWWTLGQGSYGRGERESDSGFLPAAELIGFGWESEWGLM